MTDNVAERYTLLPGSPEEIEEELASLVKELEVEVDRGENRCGQEDDEVSSLRLVEAKLQSLLTDSIGGCWWKVQTATR